MCEARWESVWAWVAILLLCVPAVRSDAQACPALDAEVEAVVRGGEAGVLRTIAPLLGPRGHAALLVRAEAGDADAVLAMGLAGQSEALRALRERRITARPARSLALLALGDGSETGTVTRALLGPGSPAERARVAGYLAQLRAVRAREILELALTDPEPLVRLEAARPLARARHPRARRVLADLARNAAEPIKSQAAEASARAPSGAAEDLIDELESEAPPSPTGVDAGMPGAPSAAPDALARARARLAGPDGDALRAAVRLMGESAATSEVAGLLGVARRRDVSAETRAQALGAALRLCPK